MVAVGFGMAFQYGLIKSILVTTLGGMAGVAFFVYLKKLLLLFPFLQRRKNTDGRIRFTRKKRMIVRLKNSVGLVGIAFLTPVFLSVPLGTIAALLLGVKKGQLFLAMLIAFLFWSTIFFGTYYLLGVDLYEVVMAYLA